MSDLISVIIPIYNVEQYLRQCLDSVINQTYKNLEIILVDDGSTDNSGKICDEYALKDARIKVIHKENGGVSSARNAGLDIAKGDYIGFVDSDDYIEKDMYEYLYSLNKNNNTLLSVCNFYIKKNKKIIEAKPITNKTVLSANEMLECSFKQLFSVNKLIARNLFYDLRFPKDIRYGEDMTVCMELFIRAKKISYGKQCKYFYRQHENCITNSFVWHSKNLGFIHQTDKIAEYAKSQYLNTFYSQLFFAQTNITVSFLKNCVRTEPFDLKSANFMVCLIKKRIFYYLKTKAKISKKIFATLACVNLDLLRLLYKLLLKLRVIK